MNQVIFIKYGELTTKKSNRNQFIKTLVNNINRKLKGYDYELEYNRDRIYIHTNQIKEVTTLLQDVFGIYSIVIAHQTDSNLETIKTTALEMMNLKKINTFKAETKRTDKEFPTPSMEVSRLVGSYLLKNISDLAVDVNQPDTVLTIEIRKEFTYLYTDEIEGAKGYPTAVQSKGLLMLSGGIDSPVAGYLALKKGIEIECIYFESPPHTSLQALNKVKSLVKILTKYQPKIKLHIVPFTSLQEAIYKNVNNTYMITILRRMMYRISEQVALKYRNLVIVNGESIGQVASQTLTSMNCINSVTNFPIIRPLACFDKEEIITLSKKIGTYNTSILPYEDCCTIFVPKHPVINPSLDMCLKYETEINYHELIAETISNINTVVITNEDKKDYQDLL